jgi:PTS system ascorbate-specific IIB component
MLKVLAACGAGMGSSQIIKMKIKKVLDKLGIESNIDHMSVGQAKSMVNNYDIIFVAEGLKNNFSNASTAKLIGLKNLLSEEEIEEKIKDCLNLD